MKKLVLGLIATVLFAFNGNAQEKLSQEDLRVILAQGMVDFTNSLKPAYEKTDNLEDFKKMVAGSWYSKIPKEGNNLLDKAYQFLSKNTSDEEIAKSYNGKEIAEAALYVDSLSKKGVKTDGSELFGGTTGDFNSYATSITTAKCKWYQIACWLKEIFGDVEGEIILITIVRALTILIATL
jgi:hypothetical protein